jgi:hypothetical protein
MADGLGWFGALRPDGPTKSGLMLHTYFLAPFEKMWSKPSPGWFRTLFPGLMVLLIVWLNVLNA